MHVKASTVRATKPVAQKRLIHSAVVVGSTTATMVLVLTRTIVRTCALTPRRITVAHVPTNLRHVQQTIARWSVHGLTLQIVRMSAAAPTRILTVRHGTIPHRIVGTQDQATILVVPVTLATLAILAHRAALTTAAVAVPVVAAAAAAAAQAVLVRLLQEAVRLLRVVAKIDTNLK